MAVALVQLALGFLCLLGGADLVVRGGLGLARIWRLPPAIVGLTVVSIASTAPEFTLVVRAAAAGEAELVMASVVGCTITNLFLILGLVAFWRPVSCEARCLRWMAAVLLLSCGYIAIRSVGSPFGTPDGVLLLLACVAIFGVVGITQLERFPTAGDAGARAESPVQPPALPLEPFPFGIPTSRPMILLFLALGAILLPLGATLAVESVLAVAMGMGISAGILGLTVVALGTCIPELATALVALWQQRPGVAIGNIIGSSLLNLLFVLGFGILFSPSEIQVPPSFVHQSVVPMTLGAMVLALHVGRRWRIGRGVGALLLLGYVAFIAGQILAA